MPKTNRHRQALSGSVLLHIPSGTGPRYLLLFTMLWKILANRLLFSMVVFALFSSSFAIESSMFNDTERLIHQDFCNDHLVEVRDHGGYRSLYFGDNHLQSRMSLSRPHDLVLAYTGYMVLPLLINSSPMRVFVAGIGSGSFVRFFTHHFPNCSIDAVDNSPHIIKAAKDYFCLPENDRVAIHCCDGLRFLQENSGNNYDLMLVDAFDAVGMAPSIYSEPFFTLCATRLTTSGVLSCNLWSDDKKRLKEITASLTGLFTSLLFLPVHNRGNIVALAMPFATPWPLLLRKPRDFIALAKQYRLDFRQMVKVAKQNNLTLAKRLSTLFH
ncbi:MAG: fused MFS/spermidine synthase [Desulforhopalus sp.]